MENRKCQLQTWKVEKYSGNLCAARTGRGVLGNAAVWRRRCRSHGRGELPPSAAGGAGVHRREVPCPRRGKNAAARRRGDCRCPPTGAKGGKGTVWFPCPLLTPPNPPLRRDSLRSRGETGETGLGSVRRTDFGTLLGPEFSLRKAPRITVRGHPVQGGGVPLRKAPLRSRVYPWSTKRPCGPLAFRRATEGSRVLRKMRGSQEGDKKPFGVLSPFCSRR